MKKILSILSLISISSMVSTNVIACNTITKYDISTTLKNINWYDFYNQRYDKYNLDLFSSVYHILNKASADNVEMTSIANDTNLTVTITDTTNNNSLVNNDQSLIQINDSYEIEIDINSSDQFFDEYNNTFKDIKITPINPNILTDNSTAEYSQLLTDLSNSTNNDDAYNAIRTYVANVANANKNNTNNADTTDDLNISNLTLTEIKADPNFGISLWNNDVVLSDDESTTFNKDNWTAINFTIGNINGENATIFKDQYFGLESDTTIYTITLIK